ncbi:conserved hypothetical protein [Ricinus communis]|uniref:Uncharacterized protein n=1 Tax=Ricinus communis TaxID=3988 RepID=B9SZN9_RICCO|nr:conserved hypothetical protein [Ricinus communis]
MPYDKKIGQKHRVEKHDRQLTVREMESVGLESPTLNSGIHMRHINDIGLDGKEVLRSPSHQYTSEYCQDNCGRDCKKHANSLGGTTL